MIVTSAGIFTVHWFLVVYLILKELFRRVIKVGIISSAYKRIRAIWAPQWSAQSLHKKFFISRMYTLMYSMLLSILCLYLCDACMTIRVHKTAWTESQYWKISSKVWFWKLSNLISLNWTLTLFKIISKFGCLLIEEIRDQNKIVHPNDISRWWILVLEGTSLWFNWSQK